jgi:hypothetical protein
MSRSPLGAKVAKSPLFRPSIANKSILNMFKCQTDSGSLLQNPNKIRRGYFDLNRARPAPRMDVGSGTTVMKNVNWCLCEDGKTRP